MKIKYKKIYKKETFKDLKIGDIFKFQNDLCMKVGSKSNNYNTFNFNGEHLTILNDNQKIKILNGELVIRG